MVSPFRQLFARVTAMALLSVSALAGAEDNDSGNAQAVSPFPIGSRERPLIVRTFLPDLINDPQRFPNHRQAAAAAGYDPQTGRDTDVIIAPVDGLPAAIAVSFGDDLSIAWDTVECHWLYAWRGGFLDMTRTWGGAAGGQQKPGDHLPAIVGDLVYLADGPAPLSVSIGALEDAVKFYGYRLVDGVPEFLYMIGGLKVAERIQPGEDGKTIAQHFSVERNNLELMLSAPSAANSKDSVNVINGERKGDYVIVSKNNAKDFTLIHAIGSPVARPDLPRVKAMTIPLLTQNSTPPVKATPVGMPTPAPAPKSEQPIAAPTPQPRPAPTPQPKPAPIPQPKPAPIPQPKPAPAPQPAPRTMPVAPVAPAAPSEPAISIISRAERYDREILLTDPEIEAGGLKRDANPFVDRSFKFSELPEELIGADFVRTFDRDKYIPGDILSYRLQLESDANVYLLFDKRLDPMPDWVGKRFKDTGKSAALDAGKEFRVMHAVANAGEIRFGPQDSGARAHFYVIAATPRGDSDNKAPSK